MTSGSTSTRPGGDIYALLSIYDTMQYVRNDVSTTVMGMAASAAAVILAAGTKGKRFALPNSRVLIHQPRGQAGGQAADIEIWAREVLGLRARLDEILAAHTGQAIEKIKTDTDRDFIMTARRSQGIRDGRRGHHGSQAGRAGSSRQATARRATRATRATRRTSDTRKTGGAGWLSFRTNS